MIKKNVRLANALRRKLEQASLGSIEILSEVAIDLADIATIGEKHKRRLKELLHLQLPQDLEKLDDLLAGFEVDLLWENEWHLKSLKRGLPKLVRNLNQHLAGARKRAKSQNRTYKRR